MRQPLAGPCAEDIACLMVVPPGSRECLATLIPKLWAGRMVDATRREWTRYSGLGPVETKAKEAA